MTDERGMSETVSWAVMMPLMLLCLLGALQAGIWVHARTAVEHAASAAADVASFSTPEQARQAALGVTRQADVSGVEVVVTDLGDRCEVVVSGRARLLMDLGPTLVRGSAVAAKEVR